MHHVPQEEMKDAWANGKKMGPSNDKKKYTCPSTGAHFEFSDMWNRIHKLHKQRELGVDHFIRVCLRIHTQMDSVAA
jgi:hypothetical protein